MDTHTMQSYISRYIHLTPNSKLPHLLCKYINIYLFCPPLQDHQHRWTVLDPCLGVALNHDCSNSPPTTGLCFANHSSHIQSSLLWFTVCCLRSPLVGVLDLSTLWVFASMCVCVCVPSWFEMSRGSNVPNIIITIVSSVSLDIIRCGVQHTYDWWMGGKVWNRPRWWPHTQTHTHRVKPTSYLLIRYNGVYMHFHMWFSMECEGARVHVIFLSLPNAFNNTIAPCFVCSLVYFPRAVRRVMLRSIRTKHNTQKHLYINQITISCCAYQFRCSTHKFNMNMHSVHTIQI